MPGGGGTISMLGRSLGEYCGAGGGTVLLDDAGCDRVTTDRVKSSEVTVLFPSNSQHGNAK